MREDRGDDNSWPPTSAKKPAGSEWAAGLARLKTAIAAGARGITLWTPFVRRRS
jgi:hypothetical protein